jgi:hypothetical protein
MRSCQAMIGVPSTLCRRVILRFTACDGSAGRTIDSPCIAFDFLHALVFRYAHDLVRGTSCFCQTPGSYLAQAVGHAAIRQARLRNLAAIQLPSHVPLGGAANSLARRLLGRSPDELMELFKTALFNGDFDDGPEDYGESGVAWLRTAVETSKRRYGFTRCSVVGS